MSHITADRITLVRASVQFGLEGLRDAGGQEAIDRLAILVECVDQHQNALTALAAEFSDVKPFDHRLSTIVIAALVGAAVARGVMEASG